MKKFNKDKEKWDKMWFLALFLLAVSGFGGIIFESFYRQQGYVIKLTFFFIWVGIVIGSIVFVGICDTKSKK